MESQEVRDVNDCFVSAVRTAKISEVQRALMVYDYVVQLCRKKIINPEHVTGLTETLLSRVSR